MSTPVKGDINPSNRTKKGIVTSSKGDKTVVVRVDSHFKHPLYEKRVLKSKKFHAHDEENKFSEGDVCTIKECRPLSKKKRWVVVS